jgi:hypothetical protein
MIQNIVYVSSSPFSHDKFSSKLPKTGYETYNVWSSCLETADCHGHVDVLWKQQKVHGGIPWEFQVISKAVACRYMTALPVCAGREIRPCYRQPSCYPHNAYPPSLYLKRHTHRTMSFLWFSLLGVGWEEAHVNLLQIQKLLSHQYMRPPGDTKTYSLMVYDCSVSVLERIYKPLVSRAFLLSLRHILKGLHKTFQHTCHVWSLPFFFAQNDTRGVPYSVCCGTKKSHVGAAWEHLKNWLARGYVCPSSAHRNMCKSSSSLALLLSLHYIFELLKSQ